MRNNILHGEESELTEREVNRKTARLLEFKRKKEELLSRNDYFLIDYDEWEIRKWSAEKKTQKILNLERMHRVYLSEVRREAEGLRKITDFFSPLR